MGSTYRFTTFRGIVLVFICLLSSACITLSWLSRPYLTYKTSLVVITAIPGSTVVIIITCLLIRPIAKSRRLQPIFKQTVLWEVLWTGGLIPFNIILCMIDAAIEPTGPVPPTVRKLLIAMKAAFIANAALLATYSFIVYCLTLAMYYTIDGQIWFRELHDDPPPFPLYDFLRYWRRGHEGQHQAVGALGMGVYSPQLPVRASHFCVLGSGCCAALAKPAGIAEIGLYRGSRSVGSIVSIPSVVERRSQITVVLDVVRD